MVDLDLIIRIATPICFIILAVVIYAHILGGRQKDKLLAKAYDDIHEFTLFSLSAKASKETAPMVGPAILQKISTLNNTPQVVPENENTKIQKTGVSLHIGANR